MKKIVVLTGAGVSAESGISTFRDADGLWEGHDVMEVASPQGWEQDRKKVLEFYNLRRRQLKEVQPNAAHKALRELEEKYEVHIITQNVDDLHERAGSSNVIHLHGQLKKVRSTFDEKLVLDWEDDLNEGDLCEHLSQLRPDIVWFGEEVPMMERAIEITAQAEILIIIGTSLQVYPAAGLMDYTRRGIPVYFIDPKPAVSGRDRLIVYAEKASVGVRKVVDELLSSYQT